jgi:hypothetical protein
MVRAVADALQVPADLPSTLALGILAACGSNRFSVKVDNSYSEPLNLYLVAVLPPGERKSAAYRLMANPLYDEETRLRELAAPELRKARERRAVAEERLKRLRKIAADDTNPDDQLRLSAEAASIAEDLEDIPAEPRLVAGDATPERISALLAENHGRLAVMTAEGGGVFEIAGGKYSRNGSSNLEVFLCAHAGDQWRSDRVTRSAEVVERPALTLALTIQPDVLGGLRGKQSFLGRGFIGRFLYSLPNSLVGSRLFGSRPEVPPFVKDSYHRLVRDLLSISDPPPAAPYVLSLSQLAFEIHRSHANLIESEQADGGCLYEIKDWASKLAGATLRIAGGLHLAANPTAPWGQPISQKTMVDAWTIGLYYREHAQAAYAFMQEGPQVTEARRILRWIERSGAEGFTKRDCYRASHHQAVIAVEPGLKELEDRGFIRLVIGPSTVAPTGGRRASPMYVVHPRLHATTDTTDLTRQGKRSVSSVSALEATRLADGYV